MKFKMIKDPQEGELVQFLGVYALRWRPEWGEPTVAFVEDDEPNIIPDLVAALKALVDCPTVKGLSAAIRDHARQRGVTDEYEQARAALKKAGVL